MLTVAISRSGMVQAQQQIRAIAYGVASGGILLAIVFSLWIAARVSRPMEQLARAAEEVASGSWDTQVPERGRDEVAVLARSFNHMTEQLPNQRERLVQSERVAAWRELARRLAHELKNPLFPLQLTVENLVRARQLPAAEFDEVFQREHADAGHGDRQSEEDHRALQRLQQDAEAGAGTHRCAGCGGARAGAVCGCAAKTGRKIDRARRTLMIGQCR